MVILDTSRKGDNKPTESPQNEGYMNIWRLYEHLYLSQGAICGKTMHSGR